MTQPNRLKLPAGSLKAQLEGRAKWNRSRSIEAADFYTFGYAGRKTDVILTELERAGVRTVLDIRQYAVSMYRPDLTKSNFARLLAARGISYYHLPELGVPRDVRAKAIAVGSRDPIWEWYDEHVAGPAFGRNLHWFLNGFEPAIAMMCTETDPHECHRHRVATLLEAQGFKGFDL